VSHAQIAGNSQRAQRGLRLLHSTQSAHSHRSAIRYARRQAGR
jgi:hypothetical protein